MLILSRSHVLDFEALEVLYHRPTSTSASTTNYRLFKKYYSFTLLRISIVTLSKKYSFTMTKILIVPVLSHPNPAHILV